jgi:periplasmic protein TonB
MQREFIFTDKWLELVFKNRNQSYGAYVLRKRLPRNILIGYMASIIFMGSALFTGYQFSKISIKDIEGFINVLPPPIIYEIKPPVLPAEPKSDPEQGKTPPKSSTQDFIPIVKDSAAVSEDEEKISKTDNVPESKDTAGIVSDNDNSPAKETEDVKKSIGPYDGAWVQKVPEFREMTKYMINNTHYPEHLIAQGIGGTVYVSFIVDSTGKVTEVKAKNNIEGYPEFADEAVRSVSKMPRWIPGQQNGMNVSVIMILPVKFSVKKDF